MKTRAVFQGSALLLYTDGLADSIRAEDREARIRDAVTAPECTTSTRMALVDRHLNEDDITLVLVKRGASG